MPAPRRLYVAATNQHVGKTTSTLGIISLLQSYGLQIGYCKPLGQKFVEIDGQRVDKDAPLFTQYLNIDLDPSLHSPVILGPGVAAGYMDNPGSYQFVDQVQRAAARLQSIHDLVVFEGSGHPGVGSVVDLSNAKVAQLLGAGAILIVEAGIGRTIDQITLNKAVFNEQGVPIMGVIINKCQPEKIEKVRHYVGRKLHEMGIPLLGVVPFLEELAFPIMETVRKSVEGRAAFYPENLNNRVEGLLTSNQLKAEGVKPSHNQLLITSTQRLDHMLSQMCQYQGQVWPLSGLVLSGGDMLSPQAREWIHHYHIPVVFTEMDTYEAVIEFSRIKVKLNPKARWKIDQAIEHFTPHLNLEPLFAPKVAVKC